MQWLEITLSIMEKPKIWALAIIAHNFSSIALIKTAQYFLVFCLLAIAFTGVAQKGSKPLSDNDQLKFDLAFVNGNKEKILFNYDDALKQFRYCYGLQPDNAAVNFIIGDVYFQKKMYEDAERYVAEATKLEKDNIWYKELLVDIYIARKKKQRGSRVDAKCCKNKKRSSKHASSFVFICDGKRLLESH